VAKEPFDLLAQAYDQDFALTAVGQFQREQVWHQIRELWPQNAHLLELGCGTGIDAQHFAEQGFQVLATDISSEMLREAQRRCADLPQVSFKVLDASDIGQLQETFDGAFSNFAAINCVLDLASFAEQLASRLHSGSPVALCLFGRSCAWEIVTSLLAGKPQRAFRRWRSGIITAGIGQGETIAVRYYGISEFKQSFAPWFALEKVVGIGCLVPPTYLQSLVARWPSFFRLCNAVDKNIGNFWPANQLSDHVLYILRRC
jgi:SAM-dependent methyltransferase